MKAGLVRPTMVNGGRRKQRTHRLSAHTATESLQSIDERVLILIGMKHYLVKNHDRDHELTHNRDIARSAIASEADARGTEAR